MKKIIKTTTTIIDPWTLYESALDKKDDSKFLEAVPLLQESLAMAGRDAELRLAANIALGDTFRMVGDFVGACASYKKGQKLAIRLKDTEGASDAEVGWALSRRALGYHGDAIKILNGALRTYRAEGDRTAVAFTTWARAGAYRIKGDIKKTITGFGESKELFTRLKDRSGLGYSLTGLGGASRVEGDYKASLKYYRCANKLFTELDDTFGVAYSYCGLANARRMLGDYKESAEFFKKATRNYRKIGDRVSYAYTLWGEGTLLHITGKKKRAMKDFEEARALFTETRDVRGLIYIEISFSQMDFMEGREGAAMKRIKGALKKAEKYGLGLEIRYCKMVLKEMNRGGAALPLNLA